MDDRTYHFENFTPFALSYEWDFGDGTSDTSKHVTHIFDSEGFYQVCLTAHRTDIASQQFCEWLNIGGIDTCAARFLPLRYYQSEYGHVQFWNLSYYEEEANTAFQWDFGDGTTSNEKKPIHQYKGHDNYNVCLTVEQENGCISEYCEEVSAGCKMDFSIDYHSGGVRLRDESTHYGSVHSRKWEINGKFFYEFDEELPYIDIGYSDIPGYPEMDICLEIRGRNDCSIYCKQAKSPKKTEHLLDKTEWLIFPNPFDETLQLMIPSNVDFAQVKIWSANGKLIYANDAPKSTIQISTHAWETGMYFVQMITSNGVSSQRLLKKPIFIKQTNR